MNEGIPIGERARELRRWRGLTLSEVAGLAGITKQYLSMIENGRRPLDRRSLWRLAITVERGEGGGTVLEMAKAIDPAKTGNPTRRAALYLDTSRGLARDPRMRAEAVRWLHRAEQTAPQLIRNYPAARETVTYLLGREIAAAGGRELRGMAARMGVPH